MSEFVNNGMRRVRLNEVIRQFMDFRGRTPLKLGMEWGGGEIRALSANNVQMGRIDFSKEAYFGSDALYQRWMTKGDCEKGDVAFTTEAPLGNVAQIPDGERYILSQRVILLKANKAIAEPAYLFQLFQSEAFQSELVRQSTGSTVLGIQQARLARVEVDILPLPQQRRISEILSTVDEAIEQTEALIAKYQQIKAGLMHDLFTRGVTSDGHLRPTCAQVPHLYKESPLGWIPKEWDIEELGGITPNTAPICYGIVQPGQYHHDGIPVVAIYNLNSDYSLTHRSSPLIEASYVRSRVQENDVLLSIKGSIGRVDVAPSGFIGNISRDVARIRPRNGVVPVYLRYLLESDQLQAALNSISVGTTRLELSIGRLKRVSLPLPKPPEQILIAEKLMSLDDFLRSVTENLQKLRDEKHGLMHDLLTDRVPVKVGEPAST